MSEKLIIEELKEYNEADAAAVGRLLSLLSPRRGSQPISKDSLEEVINSDSSVMLVARLDNVIVGSLTLNLILTVTSDRHAYLDDFVTDEKVRGQGIGSALWMAALDWCRQKQATSLDFTSNNTRSEAQQFYLKRGAVKRDTSVFRYSFDKE